MYTYMVGIQVHVSSFGHGFCSVCFNQSKCMTPVLQGCDCSYRKRGIQSTDKLVSSFLALMSVAQDSSSTVTVSVNKPVSM